MTLLARRADVARRGASGAGAPTRQPVTAGARGTGRRRRSGCRQRAGDRARGARDRPCDLTITSARHPVHRGYFAEVPIDVFEEMLRSTILGTLYAVRAVLPGMRARARLLWCSSSSGARHRRHLRVRSLQPQQFALRGLAEVLRAELAQEAVQRLHCLPARHRYAAACRGESDQAGRNARDRGRREDLAGGRRGALHPGRRRSEPVRDHAGVGDDLAASRAQRRLVRSSTGISIGPRRGSGSASATSCSFSCDSTEVSSASGLGAERSAAGLVSRSASPSASRPARIVSSDPRWRASATARSSLRNKRLGHPASAAPAESGLKGPNSDDLEDRDDHAGPGNRHRSQVALRRYTLRSSS